MGLLLVIVNPRPAPAGPVPGPLATMPVVAGHLTFVREYTNGAAGWDDTTLTALLAQTTYPAVDQNGTPTGDTVIDLWASAALVLELRLVKMMDDPRQGAKTVKAGDGELGYGTPGSSTGLLRALIRRYWRRASPQIRNAWQPSGWRTVDVGVGMRYMLGSVLGTGFGVQPGQVVNSPSGEDMGGGNVGI